MEAQEQIKDIKKGLESLIGDLKTKETKLTREINKDITLS